MSYRAVLTGAGLLIVSASCEGPDGGGLFRPFVDVPALASDGGMGGSETSASEMGGAGGTPGEVSPMVDAGSSVAEGQGGSLGLVGAAGTSTQPSTLVAGAGGAEPGDAGVLVEVDAAPVPPPCSDNVELCDGLDNDCDEAVDEGNACAADCAGFALEGRGYMFCSASVVRDVAADRCELEGMRLAWIESDAENELLVDSIAAADVPAPEDDEILVYIGANDSATEGTWIWRGRGAIADGFQFWQGANAGNAVNGSYESWSPGEPNNTDDDENCGVLSVFGGNNRAPGNWDDRDCDSALPFVCEVP